MGAKALNAQGWVLSRKMNRRPAADSLFWNVVREYPATESQLAARDYLELAGTMVPEDLIKLPQRMLARADTTLLPPDSTGGLPDSLALEPSAPIAPTPLASGGTDSLHRMILYRPGSSPPPPTPTAIRRGPPPQTPPTLGQPNDMSSGRFNIPPAPADTLRPMAPDTTRRASPPDTSRSAPSSSARAPADSAASDTTKAER
jgi:hypothetical protein